MVIVEFLMGYYPILDRARRAVTRRTGFPQWIRRDDEYDGL